jgi:hypothetical protein
MDGSQRKDDDPKRPERKPQREDAGGEDTGSVTPERNDEKAGREARERQEEADVRLGRRANWAAIVSAAVGAAALALAYLTFFKGDDPVPAAAPRTARLERVDLIARNGLPPHKPGLELLVHNDGRGRSVVSRARIEVLRVYPMPLCFTQGELPVSGRYGVRLPEDSQPGDVVEVPIHQQVPPDGADRFVFDLGVAPADPGSDTLEGLYLFEVEVSLVHDDGSSPLPMGKALVSLEELPFTTEYLLRKGQFSRLEREYGSPPPQTWMPPLPCWQANGRTLLLAASSEATRSRQLQTIMDVAVVPSLSEAEPH